MKKIIIFILMLCGLVTTLSGCFEAIEDISTAVENLKLTDTKRCASCSIKYLDSDYNSSASYYITPNGFEMDKLEEKGYYMEIKVTYDVYYKKDYDVLWDIGYAGSPRYEISIMNSDFMGKAEKDLSTTLNSVSRQLTIRASVADINNQRWVLTFSTDNIQNIIYFNNIIVNYRCFK